MKKMFPGIVTILLLCSCNNESTQTAQTATEDAAPQTEMKAAEIGDAKNVEVGKRFLSSFSKGDIDAWLNDFADDAVFVWSSGDSVVGKSAIGSYWKERWTGLDSITFTKDIWLPLQVNTPQSVEAPGTWVLGWYMFDEKFKNGKRAVQWAHDDMHLNSEGKVDRMIHYVDMAPIRAAMGK